MLITIDNLHIFQRNDTTIIIVVTNEAEENVDLFVNETKKEH